MLTPTLSTLLYLVIAAFGSFIAGWFLSQFVLKKLLEKAVATSKTKVDNSILKTVTRILPVWAAGIGVWFWLPYSQLQSSVNDQIRSVVVVGLALYSIWVVQNTTAVIINSLTNQNRLLPESSVISNLARLVIILLGSIFILQYFNISITPIVTALGVGGLAVALALQPTLENLFSGLQMLASKKIKPGNFIELENGQTGYVEDVTWRYTVIRSLPNNRIVIPNKEISNAILINYHQPGSEMSVVITLGVDYDSDLEHVEKVVVDEATKTMADFEEISVPDFEPFVRYNNFANSAIEFSVILRVKEYVGKYELTHAFLKNIHKRFKKEKISIPYPTRRIIQ